MKQSHTRAATVPYHSVRTNSSTDDAFVRFMHEAFGSPAISSFAAAVKRKYMPSLSRLTSSILVANPPHTTPTALGHLDQIRQGQQSTKRFKSLFQDVEDDASELEPPISDLHKQPRKCARIHADRNDALRLYRVIPYHFSFRNAVNNYIRPQWLYSCGTNEKSPSFRIYCCILAHN